MVHEKAYLTGPEFRFLRKELGLSQASIGKIIGSQAQTIALWEKRGRINLQADRWIRAIYREYVDGNAKLRESVDEINELDRISHELKMEFENTRSSSQNGGGWVPKVA